MMDADTVESVVASNFQRNFRARQARQREQEKLPPSVQNVIAGIAKELTA